MIKFILSIFVVANLFATAQMETSKTCKGCHPIIYNEFYDSAHRKGSIFEDDIHKAIWDKHPDKQKNIYTCNECHTPSDTRITDELAKHNSAMPQNDALQTQEAISCVYCHSIMDIEKHATPYDKNILTTEPKMIFAANPDNRDGKIIYKEEKSFFGMFKKTSGSPFHNIDFGNKGFYNGKMCMGCHAHFENAHGQNVCLVDETGASNEESNCITCHMPKVKGSATTIAITKTHAFHGFAGVRNKPEMLAKYLTFKMNKTQKGFDIVIKNLATHHLLMHPLRLGKLKVGVNNGTKTTALKTVPFFRTLGHDGKPAMSWVATEVFEDTMLKAKEQRVISYDTQLNSGDTVEIEFGYFLVNPKMQKVLNLENSKEAKKYFVLKTQNFIVE
ncbi:MAG: multiheme c-type cytochrome [Campylobacterota bacterium]|nr:multiheme c-type cytochrome [Campylobacterota bacterium]